ncbi:MAG TPA: hydantoinase/oxoprolinase family protein [Solirubrobacteraceae bacterium]|nr:hydantoinase/oxoprolinase family protein [Solirubrobacteraceae bacterium]
MPDVRVGVVSGASSTDAVAIDARDRLIGIAAVPATPDAGAAGIAAAIGALVDGGVDPSRVRWVTLGTGHERRDVVAAHGVRKVAVVRIGAPLTLAVPPLATWPQALRERICAGAIVVRGGAEYDGRHVAPLDTTALAGFLATLGATVDAVAITGVFSPVSSEQEEAAAAVARRELGPAVHVSMSHEIGSIGLLERENSTVFNAALADGTARLAATVRAALDERAIDAELFFTQNDGTLMAAEHALRFPALMIAAGPGMSMRGAAQLSGVGDAVVVHVGATSTSVGALVSGVPRERTGSTDIAGVRTSLRLPDARHVPFGIGSVVALGPGRGAIGPESVGFALAGRALVFGGTLATVADAAVAGGRVVLGSHDLDSSSRRPLAHALRRVDAALAAAVEDASAGRPATPLVVVGPGHWLVPDGLGGAGEMIRPPDGALAHAIGAAMASVSGQAERICSRRPDRRQAALEEARAAALARAIDAGADPAAVEVSEVEEVPLTHLLRPALRIRVRAVGPRG